MYFAKLIFKFNRVMVFQQRFNSNVVLFNWDGVIEIAKCET